MQSTWTLPFQLQILKKIRDGITVTPEDEQSFGAVVRGRTLLASIEGSRKGLQRLPTVDGYLVRDFGEKHVFVPFNIVPVFPDESQLGQLSPVLRRTQLEDLNPICVSGSTTFLGETDEITDIDFCEYYLSNIDSLPGSVGAKVPFAPPGPLVRIKVRDELFVPPFLDVQARVEACGCSPEGDAPGSPVKLDFVQITPNYGSIPVTNLVLPCRSGETERGNALRSFVFQEAVVAPRSQPPPRTLLAVASFAAYVGWLYREVGDLLTNPARQEMYEDWPVKALKRILSLYLALGLPDSYVGNIIRTLNEGRLRVVVKRIRAKEVRKLCSLLDAQTGAAYTQHIRATEDGIDVTDEEIREALDDATELTQSLLDELNLWLQNAPPRT